MRILFEDYHCVAVNKPAGLLTQAPPGVPSLEAEVKAHVKAKYDKPGNVYLGIPHRLDRPVSGVVLFARNTKAARRIATQFQAHTVHKVYWAAVSGVPHETEGTWDDHVRKVSEESRAEACEPDAPGAKRAVTHYRVLREIPGGCLLELAPETGRMHQLRLQSSLRGHPVMGDPLYGSETPFGPPADLPRDRVIALHARGLTFQHPTKLLPLTLLAGLPDYWPSQARS